MAHIVMYVAGIEPAASGDGIRYTGIARLSGMDSEDANVAWEVVVTPSALAATVNQEIQDAAISAAEQAEYEVGPTDKKTLLGGAVGL